MPSWAGRRVRPSLHDNSSSLQREQREEETEGEGVAAKLIKIVCTMYIAVSQLRQLKSVKVNICCGYKIGLPLVNAAMDQALSLHNFLSSARAVT